MHYYYYYLLSIITIISVPLLRIRTRLTGLVSTKQPDVIWDRLTAEDGCAPQGAQHNIQTKLRFHLPVNPVGYSQIFKDEKQTDIIGCHFIWERSSYFSTMTYFSLTFSVISFLRQMKLLWKHPESKEYQELKKINRSSGGGVPISFS